jgi:hypothetical protein
MKLISDPDHWFELNEGDSTPAHAVVSPDGTDGLLLTALPTQRLRELRDAIDKGDAPDSPLIVRDLAAAEREYPTFVARAAHESAPRIIDQYPEFEAALKHVSGSPTFADIRRVSELLPEPDTLNPTVVGDVLQVVIARRNGRHLVPRPQTVDHQPDVIATILGYDPDASLRTQIIRDQLIEGPTLLSRIQDLSDRERLWLTDLGWVEQGAYTTAGELARQYAREPATGRAELEALALLGRARDHASDNGNLLVSNKLEDAIGKLDVDVETLPDDLRSHFVSLARPAAYERAIEVAREAEALRIDAVLDVDSPDEILQGIRQSRPDRLSSVRTGLGQVPLSLFTDVPAEHLPPTIAHILIALDPRAVGNALDEAIADRASQLDKTLEQLEAIHEQLKPVFSTDESKQLSQMILSARTMRNLMSPPEPSAPSDCVELYSDHLEREVTLDFGFEDTKQQVGDAILAVCEEYIRDRYRSWATSERSNREVAMIVDTPALVKERFDEYDHLIVMISDGFGLRQWLEGKLSRDTIQDWYTAGIASDTLMTTVFPSETGAGHYSFLTGQFPSEHGRDNIKKTIDVDSVALFEAARDVGAHVHAYSYLPASMSGFNSVMAAHADGFDHLEGMQAESAALTGKSQQAVASTIAQHDRSLNVIQHNQIDQLHEGSDHIADTLVSSVAADVVEYIQGLAQGLSEDVGFILTADHGMIRTRHSSQVNLTHGEALNALKQLNERYDGDRLGQRVAGLEARSVSQSSGPQTRTNTTEYFEVLPKTTMQELQALTNDRHCGRAVRMRRRYYSEQNRMTATHGALTFDEMFIPFVEFDLTQISG